MLNAYTTPITAIARIEIAIIQGNPRIAPMPDIRRTWPLRTAVAPAASHSLSPAIVWGVFGSSLRDLSPNP